MEHVTITAVPGFPGLDANDPENIVVGMSIPQRNISVSVSGAIGSGSTFGTAFNASKNMTATSLSVFQGSNTPGAHTGFKMALYSIDGSDVPTQIAVTANTPAAILSGSSGIRTLPFVTPVAVTRGTRYMAAYWVQFTGTSSVFFNVAGVGAGSSNIFALQPRIAWQQNSTADIATSFPINAGSMYWFMLGS